MKKTSDPKTIVLGFTNSIIEIWKEGVLLKRFKIEFKMLDVDLLGSCFLFLNHKCRELELFAIEWDWDTHSVQSKIDALGSDEEKRTNEIEKLLRGEKSRGKTACCVLF